MDELITDIQAEWLVAIVSAVLLAVALVALALGRLTRWFGRRGGALAVAFGPLIYLLWLLDAALIAWLGFDTLLRVGAELLIFVALGLTIGLWLRGERPVPPPDESAG